MKVHEKLYYCNGPTSGQTEDTNQADIFAPMTEGFKKNLATAFKYVHFYLNTLEKPGHKTM